MIRSGYVECMHSLTKLYGPSAWFATYSPRVFDSAAAGRFETAAGQTAMALLHQESALARSSCVRLHGNDLRHFPPQASANNSRVTKRPVSSRIHVDVTASTPAHVFGRQSPGLLLIQQATTKRSGGFARNIVHSFQSDAPVEQQIDPPPPSPKFQPFTPQVCLSAL